MKSFLSTTLLALGLTGAAQAQRAPRTLRTENVVLITLDGMREQEVFGGADSALFRQSKHYYADRNTLLRDFGQGPPEQRRQTLLPAGAPHPGTTH